MVILVQLQVLLLHCVPLLFYRFDIKAVISGGERPDLVFNELSKITAPTLLIVGGRDNVVIDPNKVANKKLICERKLEIIPEATHLFEEKGKLAEVALVST